MATKKNIQELEEQIQKLKGKNARLKETINGLYGQLGNLVNQTTGSNAEARIKYLTDELHKAQMEINRLVLENQEQDFEIHKLKKQRDELFERLDTSGFREREWDDGEFLLKDYVDKDQEELHKTATAVIFGSPEERKDASERAATNAAMIKRALEEARKKLEAEGLTSADDIRACILKMLGV